jgi:hypothetical protein
MFVQWINPHKEPYQVMVAWTSEIEVLSVRQMVSYFNTLLSISIKIVAIVAIYSYDINIS